MTNGMLWNIHKIARYGDTYMVLDRHKLKFSGNLLIEKVNVSVKCFLFLFSSFSPSLTLYLSFSIFNFLELCLLLMLL